MKFEIEEPDHELTVGYFTLMIKYIVLFIVSWIAGWIFFLLVPTKNSSIVKRNSIDDKLDNAYYISITMVVLVISYYTYSLYKKGKYGLLKEISFINDTIQLTIINQLNGKLKSIEVPTESFSVTLTPKNHILFGSQRMYTLKNNNIDITYLNIEMTAWTRHPKIENLINELEKYR